MKEYLDMWKNYANFKGRTSVRGYWMAFLFNFLATLVCTAAGFLLMRGGAPVNLPQYLYMLAALVPGLAVTVRRLRDSGRSWTCIFFALIPLAGAVILIVFLCAASEPGPDGGQSWRAQAASWSPTGQPAAAPKPAPAAPKKPPILDRYRASLRYLDSCGPFDEAKLREFNRISGDMLSEADLQKQLASSQLILGGMEQIRKLLRQNVAEAIGAFEQIERSGVDLSKYDV